MENEKLNTSEALDGSLVVEESVAKKLLKEHHNKVSNGEITSFVCLKDINKIYPNGVQAVYDFNIDIKENEFIVLVGPSGCGKSTTLRMIAGLEDITSGYLYINQVLSNYLPSKDRDISMVFQSYALYPQMTVYDNIAFPLKVRKYDKIVYDSAVKTRLECDKLALRANEILLAKEEANDKGITKAKLVHQYIATKLKTTDAAVKAMLAYDLNDADLLTKVKEESAKIITERRTALEAKQLVIDEEARILKDGEVMREKVGLTKEEIREKVFSAARILDLGPYLDRRPKELSGGQMQRVALGRAIVRDAKLFLMDEPLSNLDAKLRVAMRSEIVRIHEQIGATTIYVTHDQTEAMTMATRIAVMSKGWVQQIATPQEIYAHPKNIFVATFIGSPAMNIFDGKYNDGKVVFPNGYEVDLGPSFVETHNKFYSDKIVEVNHILETKEFKRMHCLSMIDELLDKDDLTSAKSVMESICLILKEVNEESDLAFVKDYEESLTNTKFDTKTRATLLELRKHLLHIEGVDSKVLGLLHNAQTFSKVEEPKEDTLFYQKRKNREKQQPKVVINNNPTFTNNLYDVAVKLKTTYEAYLKGNHDIRIGVRPEDIHLSHEATCSNVTDSFKIHSDIVELMGSELLIHSKWNDTDMISKISTGTLVKPHTDVELVFNRDKIHIFDAASGDTVL